MDNPDGAQSRIFVIVAVGLVALLVLGLVSIAGLVVYTRFLAPSPTPPVVAEVTPTATSVPAATATSAPITTPTVGEVPTATRVIGPEASPSPEEASPTPTPTGEGEIPDTGFGPLEAVAGGIILLVLILFVRRLRLTGQT